MSEEPRPYTLVAELTYRCPLRCVYCSNPLDCAGHARCARAPRTGCACCARPRSSASCRSTSPGGEPLLRDDLEALVEGAQRARALHQPDHQRHPARPRAAGAAQARSASTTCRCRSRTSPRRRPTASPGCARSSASCEVARWVKELGPAADGQHGAPPRQPGSRAPRSSRWPNRWPPIGWSWPTRSTSAGRWSTARRSCPRASSSSGRAMSPAPPAAA